MALKGYLSKGTGPHCVVPCVCSDTDLEVYDSIPMTFSKRQMEMYMKIGVLVTRR